MLAWQQLFQLRVKLWLLTLWALCCVLQCDLPGVKLGAVDFLAKPLAPQKLRNIWQHTVRKMMCNMNINCSDSAAAAAVDELAAAAACIGKPRVSMEVIMEETDDDLAAAAGATGKPPAPASPSATTPGSSNSSVINYSNGPNMALAITSSFYEPSKASGQSLSRCASSAMTCSSLEASGSGSAGPDSPVIDRPTKQQHGHHGPVRSCPSTRSLSSAASCYSSWTLDLPSSPSSDGLQKQAVDAAAAAAESDSSADGLAAAKGAARCIKKAIRHPPAAAAAPGCAASKPPLAGKPPAQQQKASSAGSPAAFVGKPAPFPAGMPSVPLPTGLGPLPQGMVWGMPMCPLVRAPGIVPPANASTSSTCAGQAAAGMPTLPMAPWGMCGMPMFGAMPPPPFMAGGYGNMMPSMGMPMPYAAAPAAAGYSSSMMPGMAGGAYMEPYNQQMGAYPQQQPAWGQGADMQQFSAGSAMPSSGHPNSSVGAAAPTGAAVAAALDASFCAAELLGNCEGAAADAAAAVAMDADDAFDFMLGDITAEDDITDVCGGLLDAELSVLAGHAMKVPAELSSEMQALEADLQQQAAAAAAAAAAGRCSFESSAAQRQRVSFDCSTASTCTAARASFEASQRCNSARVSFEVSTRSNRVSFEVNCHNSTKAAAAGGAGMGMCNPANLGSAASAPAELLGSVSDLFAACSGDSSHGSGLPHVDSVGALADLQSFFAASGDSSCPQDCADSALTDSSGLFLDPLDDMPIDMGMRKNDSFAELINASLPGLAN